MMENTSENTELLIKNESDSNDPDESISEKMNFWYSDSPELNVNSVDKEESSYDAVSLTKVNSSSRFNKGQIDAESMVMYEVVLSNFCSYRTTYVRNSKMNNSFIWRYDSRRRISGATFPSFLLITANDNTMTVSDLGWYKHPFYLNDEDRKLYIEEEDKPMVLFKVYKGKKSPIPNVHLSTTVKFEDIESGHFLNQNVSRFVYTGVSQDQFASFAADKSKIETSYNKVEIIHVPKNVYDFDFHDTSSVLFFENNVDLVYYNGQTYMKYFPDKKVNGHVHTQYRCSDSATCVAELKMIQVISNTAYVMRFEHHTCSTFHHNKNRIVECNMLKFYRTVMVSQNVDLSLKPLIYFHGYLYEYQHHLCNHHESNKESHGLCLQHKYLCNQSNIGNCSAHLLLCNIKEYRNVFKIGRHTCKRLKEDNEKKNQELEHVSELTHYESKVDIINNVLEVDEKNYLDDALTLSVNEVNFNNFVPFSASDQESEIRECNFKNLLKYSVKINQEIGRLKFTLDDKTRKKHGDSNSIAIRYIEESEDIHYGNTEDCVDTKETDEKRKKPFTTINIKGGKGTHKLSTNFDLKQTSKTGIEDVHTTGKNVEDMSPLTSSQKSVDLEINEEFTETDTSNATIQSNKLRHALSSNVNLKVISATKLLKISSIEEKNGEAQGTSYGHSSIIDGKDISKNKFLKGTQGVEERFKNDNLKDKYTLRSRSCKTGGSEVNKYTSDVNPIRNHRKYSKFRFTPVKIKDLYYITGDFPKLDPNNSTVLYSFYCNRIRLRDKIFHYMGHNYFKTRYAHHRCTVLRCLAWLILENEKVAVFGEHRCKPSISSTPNTTKINKPSNELFHDVDLKPIYEGKPLKTEVTKPSTINETKRDGECSNSLEEMHFAGDSNAPGALEQEAPLSNINHTSLHRETNKEFSEKLVSDCRVLLPTVDAVTKRLDYTWFKTTPVKIRYLGHIVGDAPNVNSNDSTTVYLFYSSIDPKIKMLHYIGYNYCGTHASARYRCNVEFCLAWIYIKYGKVSEFGKHTCRCLDKQHLKSVGTKEMTHKKEINEEDQNKIHEILENVIDEPENSLHYTDNLEEMVLPNYLCDDNEPFEDSSIHHTDNTEEMIPTSSSCNDRSNIILFTVNPVTGLREYTSHETTPVRIRYLGNISGKFPTVNPSNSTTVYMFNSYNIRLLHYMGYNYLRTSSRCRCSAKESCLAWIHFKHKRIVVIGKHTCRCLDKQHLKSVGTKEMTHKKEINKEDQNKIHEILENVIDEPENSSLHHTDNTEEMIPTSSSCNDRSNIFLFTVNPVTGLRECTSHKTTPVRLKNLGYIFGENPKVNPSNSTTAYMFCSYNLRGNKRLLHYMGYNYSRTRNKARCKCNAKESCLGWIHLKHKRIVVVGSHTCKSLARLNSLKYVDVEHNQSNSPNELKQDALEIDRDRTSDVSSVVKVKNKISVSEHDDATEQLDIECKRTSNVSSVVKLKEELSERVQDDITEEFEIEREKTSVTSVVEVKEELSENGHEYVTDEFSYNTFNSQFQTPIIEMKKERDIDVTEHFIHETELKAENNTIFDNDNAKTEILNSDPQQICIDITQDDEDQSIVSTVNSIGNEKFVKIYSIENREDNLVVHFNSKLVYHRGFEYHKERSGKYAWCKEAKICSGMIKIFPDNTAEIVGRHKCLKNDRNAALEGCDAPRTSLSFLHAYDGNDVKVEIKTISSIPREMRTVPHKDQNSYKILPCKGILFEGCKYTKPWQSNDITIFTCIHKETCDCPGMLQMFRHRVVRCSAHLCNGAKKFFFPDSTGANNSVLTYRSKCSLNPEAMYKGCTYRRILRTTHVSVWQCTETDCTACIKIYTFTSTLSEIGIHSCIEKHATVPKSNLNTNSVSERPAKNPSKQKTCKNFIFPAFANKSIIPVYNEKDEINILYEGYVYRGGGSYWACIYRSPRRCKGFLQILDGDVVHKSKHDCFKNNNDDNVDNSTGLLRNKYSYYNDSFDNASSTTYNTVDPDRTKGLLLYQGSHKREFAMYEGFIYKKVRSLKLACKWICINHLSHSCEGVLTTRAYIVLAASIHTCRDEDSKNNRQDLFEFICDKTEKTDQSLSVASISNTVNARKASSTHDRTPAKKFKGRKTSRSPNRKKLKNNSEVDLEVQIPATIIGQMEAGKGEEIIDIDEEHDSSSKDGIECINLDSEEELFQHGEYSESTESKCEGDSVNDALYLMEVNEDVGNEVTEFREGTGTNYPGNCQYYNVTKREELFSAGERCQSPVLLIKEENLDSASTGAVVTIKEENVDPDFETHTVPLIKEENLEWNYETDLISTVKEEKLECESESTPKNISMLLSRGPHGEYFVHVNRINDLSDSL